MGVVGNLNLGRRIKRRLPVSVGGGLLPPDFIVNDDAALTSAIAALSTTGGTIQLNQGGTFANGRTFANLTPSAPLVIKGATYGTRATLTSIVVSLCSNLTFENLTVSTAANASGGGITIIDGASTNITARSIEAFGRPLDPFGNYANPATPGTADYNGNTRYAMRCTSNGFLVNPTIEDWTCYDLFYGLTLTVRGIGGRVIGCNFDRIVSDRIQFAVSSSNLPHGLTSGWHTYGRSIGKASDALTAGGANDGVHTDGTQIDVTGSPGVLTYWDDVTFYPSLGIDDATYSRGALQNYLISSGGTFSPNIILRGWKIVGTTRVSGYGDQKSLYGQNFSEGYLFFNRGLHSTPGTGANTPSIDIPGSTASPNPSFIGACMTENFGGAAQSADFTGNGNVTLTNNTTSYNVHFDSADYGAATDQAAMLTKFLPKVGSPLDYLRNYINWGTRTVNTALEPAYVGFKPLTGQAVNTAFDSGWLKVQGGGPNQPLTDFVGAGAGTGYRIANSRAGAGASALTTANGTVSEGQFIKVVGTSSAVGGIDTPVSFKINGRTLTQSVQTVSTPFAFIDNGGIANSRAAMPGANVTYDKMILFMAVRVDAQVNDAMYLHGGTNGPQLSIPSSGKWRFQLQGANNRIEINSLSVVGQEELLGFTVDFNNTGDPNNTLKAYRGTSAATATVSGSASVTGTGTFTIGSSGAIITALRTMASGAGTGIPDGRIGMIWMHCFQDATPLPAIDPTRWLVENIGTNGEGPLGFAPLFYWTAADGAGAADGSTANTWNATAGLNNRGSIVAPMIKQGGTWA